MNLHRLSLPAAAIFDMDGVLVDSNPHHVAKWAELLKAQKIPFNPKDLPGQILGQRNDHAFRYFFGRDLPESIRSPCPSPARAGSADPETRCRKCPDGCRKFGHAGQRGIRREGSRLPAFFSDSSERRGCYASQASSGDLSESRAITSNRTCPLCSI